MDTENSAALERLRNKPEQPRIDFTIYEQEDGTTVSTRDRVIKGIEDEVKLFPCLTLCLNRCSSTRYVVAYRRRILEQRTTWVTGYQIFKGPFL